MNRRHHGHLRFNSDSRRYVLDGWYLHCGDCFQVLIGDEWKNTRIEMSKDWYLSGLATLDLDGLEARSHD
jgi:hypothetical protein